jgi:hypothetical protein
MDFLLDTLDEIAAEVFARLVDRDLGIVFVHTTSIYRAQPWAAIKKNDRDPPSGVRVVR